MIPTTRTAIGNDTLAASAASILNTAVRFMRAYQSI
jgi:hypothetical protein